MEYIRLTTENLDTEHICCAISSNKDPQVLTKKQWLRAAVCSRDCVKPRPIRGPRIISSLRM